MMLPSLLINKCYTRYTGLHHPRNSLFWRGDIFVVRYKGEPGIEHEYVDVPLELVRIIEDGIRSVHTSAVR